MARSVPLVSTIFVFLLLLLATAEMGPTMVAEARTCESQSHRFKGPCVSDTNSEDIAVASVADASAPNIVKTLRLVLEHRKEKQLGLSYMTSFRGVHRKFIHIASFRRIIRESLNRDFVLRFGVVVSLEIGGSDGPYRSSYSSWGKYEGLIETLVFDSDVWSYFVVVSVVKSLGYDGFKELWYSVGCGPILEDRLEALTDDVGAMQMVTLAHLNGRVHMYVVHNVSEDEVIDMIEFNVDEGCEDVGGDDERIADEGIADEGVAEEEVVVGQAEEVHGETAVSPDGQAGDVAGTEVDEDYVQMTEVNRAEEVEVELETPSAEVNRGKEVDGIKVQLDSVEVDTVQACEVEVEAERIQSQDGHMDDVEVGDWSSTHESDGEMDKEDELVDVDIECDISESCSDLEVDVQPFLPESDSDKDGDEINDCSWFNDEWQSDELSSRDNSDEDSEHEGYGHFSTFMQPKNMVDFKWEVGTYFVEKEDILDAIKTYAMENGRNLKFVKNDKRRIRVRCLGSKGKCPWVVYFGFMGAIKSWQVRTVFDTHTCTREHKVRLFNAKWLSRKLQKTVRENPNVKGVDIREKVCRKWNIAISKNMTYRAKTHASDEVAGSFTKQYTRIYDYAHELLERNLGSTIKVKVEPYDGKVIFQRFYACLKACKDSFLSCRPIIGLDGAFLKGQHHGELLTAVARDANDQMLPLAYAIVEVENKDTWKWFLELLIEDLGGTNVCSGLTIMSDQQKGLRYAVEDVIPGVAQRFCVRHLYANFRKKFPGKILKMLMWRAATTTHPQQWETEMRKMKAVNIDAFRHLMGIPPRSRFTSTAQSDILVNNMSEAFNSVLVNTRTKPIISMLEDIRLYMMKRWATNRSRVTSFKSSICPKIQSRLNKEAQQTKYWIPSWSAHKIFEIRHVSQSGDNFVVDIDKYTCSCRKWSINGIPCVHALTAMRFLNLNAEDYVPPCFQKSTYEEMYSSIIYPINGKHLWEVTECQDVLPPPKRQMPGRPKKKRRLDQ
ncbi:hypothetical protein V8G54_003731 [Vigna mungo]|uniref:SWIM-type domain-containing protein n=1 Tax=Vigna mungo TaxID=3915 RepID=A0AAQ3SC10_VIGMU